jgi:hypothetical protein
MRKLLCAVPSQPVLGICPPMMLAWEARAAVPIDRDRIKQVIYPTLGYPAIEKCGNTLTLEFDPRNQDWSKGLPNITDFQVTVTTTNAAYPVTRTLPLESFTIGFSTHWPEYSQYGNPGAHLPATANILRVFPHFRPHRRLTSEDEPG